MNALPSMLAHFILEPSQVFFLCIDAANLVIGFCVLLKNPKCIINQSFFFFVLGSVSWSLGISLLYITHDFSFDKLALGGGFLMFFGLTLFARVFPSTQILERRFMLIFIPLAIGLACLPFNLFIGGIMVDKDGFIQPINGPLFPFFAAITVGYVVAAIYYLISSFRKSFGIGRMQMLYFTTGITLFIASLTIFDAILPLLGIYKLNLLGPAMSLAFVLMTGYAIIRHQLMDIRVIVQRGSIYTVLLSIIIVSYLMVLLIVRYFFRQYQEIADPLLDTALTIFGILTIPHIEKYFRKITNRFFFKDRYEYSLVLEELSKVLNTNIEMNLLVFQLLRSLDAVLHPVTLEFFHTATATVFSTTGKEILPDRVLSQNFFETEVRIPVIAADDRTIGIFTFGSKRSGDTYSPEDFTLLRTFATQATVAFEKAELYQQLQEYSKGLEKEVYARTKTLEKLQASQRQLFDDISHALQTPLTVLKGTVELFKTGVASKEKSVVKIMEQSIENLSHLVKDTLRLARMDALPADTEMVRFDMSNLAQNVVEYVSVICQQSDIRIIAALAPDVQMLGNEKHIEEVLTNILSNAVHYTATSFVREIRVTLRAIEDRIELRIRDTGTGIASEELPHIFERFYRNTERDSAQKSGHGLGLAIVKRIVEEHNGEISVQSVLGSGTEFTIYFPSPSLLAIDVPE